ncbi:MAG: Lpg1974 family pore-forming outer membrane protein [Chlamydiota bacterium]
MTHHQWTRSKVSYVALWLLTAICPFCIEGLTSEHNLQYGSCHPHWDIHFDLLIWTAREAGADNWAEEIETVGTLLPSRSNELHAVDFPWDVGFRLGASRQLCWNSFDMSISFTRFYTQGTDHLAGAPGTIHSTFLGNFYINNSDGSGLSGPSYERAKIKWNIDFNIFDWNIGYKFCIGKYIAFRPYIGIKGGWINQSIHSTWENPEISVNVFQVGTENLKNDFRGIGLSAGVNTNWKILAKECGRLYLFSDLSCAMFYGHWSFKDVFKNDLPEKVTIAQQNFNTGAPMVRTFMGLEWVHHLNCKGCHFSTKLGFEMQVWLDQLKYYSFTGGRLDNQLSLQGGTVELHFGF